jgi:hypothetical protein
MFSEEENELSAGEMELEAALGGLKPAAVGFSLLQVRVRAAIRTERRRTRVWQWRRFWRWRRARGFG